MEDNEADVVEAIGHAQRYNVTELQLSHSIIMDIDEINEDADRAARIARYVDLIHEAYVGLGPHGTKRAGRRLTGRAPGAVDAARSRRSNMTAVVWSHEFNNVGLTVCFDPAGPVWEERRQAYRAALTTVPTIDGVVLMFGSSSLEPW